MPGLAAHRDHEVPARRGLGVDHEVADDVDADVARRLIAEGRDAVRQIEVVVDRLRHVDDVDPTGGGLLDLHRAVGRVVAADRDQLVDVQPEERRDRALEQLLVVRRVVAGGAERRAAAEVDAAHLLDRQVARVGDVAEHQPLEALLDAEHRHAIEIGADRRRGDHAVDARRGPAADEDAEILRVRCHERSASRPSNCAPKPPAGEGLGEGVGHRFAGQPLQEMGPDALSSSAPRASSDRGRRTRRGPRSRTA